MVWQILGISNWVFGKRLRMDLVNMGLVFGQDRRRRRNKGGYMIRSDETWTSFLLDSNVLK